MSDRTRKIVVFGIAGLALVWAVFNSPFMNDSAKLTDSSIIETIDNQMEMTGTVRPESEIEPSSDWQGDPFPRRRAVHKAGPVSKPAETLTLTAISKSGSSFMAIINGSVLSEGGTVGSWRVESIDHNSVVLSSGGAKRVLKVGR